MTLEQRWQATVDDVAAACRSCGRDPQEVRIIAVSKTVEAPVVGQALECGMEDFGENRTKPFNEKRSLYPQARWHFIGVLQSNKAKDVVGRAALIHSVDRESLLQAIQKAAAKAGVVQDVLVEVSVSGEESKGGVAPGQLHAFLEQVAACANVRCKGLMTMAPRGSQEVARQTFAGLHDLACREAELFADEPSISLTELSMGMSEDYRVAIEEGATMVRIGRRIFSEDFEQ